MMQGATVERLLQQVDRRDDARNRRRDEPALPHVSHAHIVSHAGYFESGSAIRRIGRESVLMLGGGRALLMQAAHPLVAAGIVDHSRYRDDPWRRLARTMTALYTIVFGTREQADRMGAIVRTVHRRVRGDRDGCTYSAADPDLMLWVHSTLVDTGLAMYETYVGRVEQGVAEEFYEQMKTVATVFGAPPDVHPPTLDDFRAYQREMIASGTVRVGADAREVARSVLAPPVPAALRPALRGLVLANVGLLPEPLREQYGLGWGPARAALLAASAQSSRRLVVPLLPHPLRRTERLPLRVLTAFARL
jgi:uncharacterized protein (DUF2236 family)